MGMDASYLPAHSSDDRIPSFLVPELSRRARGIPTWAMLKTLGRKGVDEMVDRHCRVAQLIARRLDDADGISVINDVVLYQIVVSFGAADASPSCRRVLTDSVINRLRDSGIMFVSGGRWRDEWVMRISVICDATTDNDGDVVADLILSTWSDVHAQATAGVS